MRYVDAYLARGWPLFVCKPRSKEPLGELVPHGFKDATTDRGVIAGWLERCPDANLAVACGYPGPQALDIDNQDAAPPYVLDAACRAPRTASARGGAAFFEGTAQRTITFDWGELRGVGSYQMVPPSIHPTGKEYTWIVEPRGKLPAAPALERRGRRVEASPEVESIPPGGGMHEHLVGLAVRLVRAGILSEQTVTTVLLAEFDARRSAPASAYGGTGGDTRRIAQWAVYDSYLAKRLRR